MTHEEMIAQIKGMTVLELNELVKAMEAEFGVSAAAAVVAVPGAAAAVEAEEEKTEFDVILKGFDAASKLKVIKAVRETTGLPLPDSKALVESAPKPIKEAVSKEEAEKIKELFTAAGAEIEIK